ncbi:MAG: carboxypeptidase regulatory-like domain-containing protein [Vulcanimicrobiaceae bacterium]
MKSLSLLAVALTFATVSGVIRDRTTSQPLPGVTVAIGSRHATTDSNGRYALKAVASGPQTLIVRSNDVPPQRFHLTVRAPATRFDMRVCSMTLDYSCSALNGSPNSD